MKISLEVSMVVEADLRSAAWTQLRHAIDLEQTWRRDEEGVNQRSQRPKVGEEEPGEGQGSSVLWYG